MNPSQSNLEVLSRGSRSGRFVLPVELRQTDELLPFDGYAFLQVLWNVVMRTREQATTSHGAVHEEGRLMAMR